MLIMVQVYAFQRDLKILVDRKQELFRAGVAVDGGFLGRNRHVMAKRTDNGGARGYLVRSIWANGAFRSTWSQTDNGVLPGTTKSSYW